MVEKLTYDVEHVPARVTVSQIEALSYVCVVVVSVIVSSVLVFGTCICQCNQIATQTQRNTHNTNTGVVRARACCKRPGEGGQAQGAASIGRDGSAQELTGTQSSQLFYILFAKAQATYHTAGGQWRYWS